MDYGVQMIDPVVMPPEAPKATVQQKLTFGAGVTATLAALVFGINAMAGAGSGIPSAVTSARAAQSASSQTEPAITRSEVELVATKAAKAAAFEVSGEAARWRDAQKVLFEVEVGRINDRMMNTNEKLDRVLDLLEDKPRRRRR